jgi:hypothetical protein
MEKIVKMAFGKETAGIVMNQFMTAVPEQERFIIDERITQMLNRVKAIPLSKDEDETKKKKQKTYKKSKADEWADFLNKLNDYLADMDNISDAIVQAKGKICKLPNQLTSVEHFRTVNSQLNNAEKGLGRIETYIHYQRGKLYDMASTQLPFGKKKEFWEQELGINSNRVYEHIKFYKFVKAFPILLSIPIGYTTYMKFHVEIIHKALADADFKAKIQRPNQMMRLGFEEFTVEEEQPDESIDLDELQSKKKAKDDDEEEPVVTTSRSSTSSLAQAMFAQSPTRRVTRSASKRSFAVAQSAGLTTDFPQDDAIDDILDALTIEASPSS